MGIHDNTVYTKDAFAHIGEKKVPLVAYDSNDDRIEIGEATVIGDKDGLRVVSVKIEDERYKDRVHMGVRDISIGEFQDAEE